MEINLKVTENRALQFMFLVKDTNKSEEVDRESIMVHTMKGLTQLAERTHSPIISHVFSYQPPTFIRECFLLLVIAREIGKRVLI